MKDQLPAPDFDRSRYERPNQDWVCGHACEGQPCRIGPSARGDCRASAECTPLLEKKPGETKGCWKCTRPREHGGPCAEGPGPAGTCGCPIIRCSPARSLRNRRGRLTWAVIALTAAGLLVAVAGPWKWNFITPARLSDPHHTAEFDQLAKDRFGQPGCAGCHQAAEAGIGQWLLAAYNSDPGLTQFSRLVQATTREETRMDAQNCVACHHQGYAIHQPDVVHAHSCSACHREHQGARMPPPTDEGCMHCHQHPDVLAAFAAKGARIPSAHFDSPVSAGAVVFRSERPPQGRINAFRSFADGHPNFGALTPGVKESNTLRFPHALHLGETVQLNGRTLQCADCHQPDSTGAYMNRISFGQNCRTCHALQFDPFNPELTLPHGSVAGVKGIIESLPLRYVELARRKGLRQADQIDEFSRQNQAKIRQALGGGEQLLRSALFNPDPRQLEPRLSAEHRAQLAGCAYCHEVKADPQQVAIVTRPLIPDRWLLGGRFNHAKHSQQTCLECHGSVATSVSATDVNLPNQQSCVRCHSPMGGAPADCATCHSYHLFKDGDPGRASRAAR